MLRRFAFVFAASSLVAYPASATPPSEITQERTTLDEDSCALVSGDYGAPSASLHVISDCTGPGGWTAVLHEYANSTSLAFKAPDGTDSGTLPFGGFGPYGKPSQGLDWILAGDEPIGVVVGYGEQAPPGSTDSVFSYYSVALKPETDAIACLISRIEFGKKRGVDAGAADIIETYAADWDCDESHYFEVVPQAAEARSFETLAAIAFTEAGNTGD
ncbi:MAG: hypothetical protein CMK09_10695 [Ponticaulis sp.]|nr:hypothetical protein [Ponticaulis sp.]|tara:strand:+ start:37907 stop:38554 length:648 start_codon:yes stop_codon:yes gene_type:complete